MEPETPAPLSVAPPTPAAPEESENIEMNQQQPFMTSPLNNSGQMLPPGTPAHKSNETLNEDQVFKNIVFNCPNILSIKTNTILFIYYFNTFYVYKTKMIHFL